MSIHARTYNLPGHGQMKMQVSEYDEWNTNSVLLQLNVPGYYVWVEDLDVIIEELTALRDVLNGEIDETD